MLADPQTVTINAVAQSLPSTARGVNTSTYTKDDGKVKLTISHAYGKRTRRAVRLDFTKTAADPLISSQNVIYSMSASLIVDTPLTGFSVTEAKQIIDALTGFLTASSDANTIAVLGGQS